MNKIEIIQWLVGHIFEEVPNHTDFAVNDLWTTLSCLIEFLETETELSKREAIMYQLRSMIKGVITSESP